VKRYGAGAVYLLVAVLVVTVNPRHWSWALLGWGVLIGIIGTAGTYAVARRAGLDADHWDTYPSFVLLSIAVAILAGGLRSAWPDMAFAAYVLVANFLVPIVLLRRLDRPQSHACRSEASCGATACATCPLAGQAAISNGGQTASR
jgi:hypothetical protein